VRINQRPSTIRDTTRGILLGVIIVLLMIAGVLLASPSKADGVLTPQEEAFGDEVASSLCGYLDRGGVNRETLYNAGKIIYENTPSYMGITDAVDIINYSVYTYCPSHWAALVAFGEGARVYG
jgi:hypothetical protein